MAKAKEMVEQYWKKMGGQPKAKRKTKRKTACRAGVSRMIERHRRGMFGFQIREFCFFERFLEDNWRRL